MSQLTHNTRLTDWEREVLIEWFMYTLPMDLRHRLMHEHPVLYNKLVGRDVMTVHQK